MNEFDAIDEQSMRTMRGDTKDGTLGRIDQYEIIRKLGGGGFGVVYLVRDTQSDVEYAIKTLHPLLKSNLEEMENLRSQFKLVSKLIHSHIAPAMILHPVREVVYSSEDVRKELRLSSGDFVMVMKYAPGVTLSHWRKQFTNGIVPVDKAIDICKHVASALDYAHSEKIIHRDIKPSNIMVETREDKSVIARVLDFGLAAEIRSSMSRVSTENGNTSGTRPYMAPEQWQGKKQGVATDQYALACMFYELVSGAVPFAGAFETGDSVIMTSAVKNELPDSLDELTADQNNAVLKALSKDMKQRFASCSDFIAALNGEKTDSIVSIISPSPKVITTTDDSSKTIICKKCGFENNKTSLFCKGCGEKIERFDICQKCGKEIDLNQKFCDKCGAKTLLCIAEEKAEAERRAHFEEEERKAREKEEAVRQAREKEEAVRQAREKAELERQTREEKERKAQEEAERQASEKAEAKRRRRSALKKLIILCLCIIVPFFVYNHVKKQQLQQLQQELLEICIPELINNMVQIPKTNFLIGKYEVTQAQWQAIMGNNPSYYRGDLHRPVEQVSWNDCQKFIKKLNARTEIKSAGITFRLPTEEEWEYACRAGSTGDYGLLADGRDGTLDEMGWYRDNSGGETHPVGQKKPNAYGLYDVHGNVWEWTASSAYGSLRIYRGGSCYHDASRCESGSRSWNDPEDWRGDFGFRLAASRTVDNNNSDSTQKEANSQVKPALVIKAKCDGKLVSGKDLVQIGGKQYDIGEAFEVIDGKNYGNAEIICKIGGKNYSGQVSIGKVTWKGTKEFVVDLKEIKEQPSINVAGIDMVRIPDSSEHKGLYFGKYEVTQEQWQAIRGNNPSFFTGDSSRPVEKVSWNDCQEFVKKLNAHTEVKQAGITFRLPTEEEWEYACRAGSTGKYGLLADGREGSLDEMGWYKDNSGDETHPVGQKKPNAWGLYDMHGNVWEWTTSANGSDRFLRGGSYCNLAFFCESGFRSWHDPEYRNDSLGFRLAASRTVY